MDLDEFLADADASASWRRRLLDSLPPAPARVAHINCGRGTLAALLVAEGYAVHGLADSPRSLALAQARVRSDRTHFVMGDPANPVELPAGLFDVVLVDEETAPPFGVTERLLSLDGHVVTLPPLE